MGIDRFHWEQCKNTAWVCNTLNAISTCTTFCLQMILTGTYWALGQLCFCKRILLFSFVDFIKNSSSNHPMNRVISQIGFLLRFFHKVTRDLARYFWEYGKTIALTFITATIFIIRWIVCLFVCDHYFTQQECRAYLDLCGRTGQLLELVA